jgi:lysozyme
MNFSLKGLEVLKDFEDLRLVAYDDGGGVWTLGYGHTEGVKPGDSCSEEQAEEWLRQDLEPAEREVNGSVKVPLTQSMYDALVIFVFNVGVKAFRDSQLLSLLNQKEYFKVPEQLCRWRYDGGKPVRGLMIRRLREALLFMQEKF